MNNTYFVKIKLFKNNLEMAQHNKVVTVIIEELADPVLKASVLRRLGAAVSILSGFAFFNPCLSAMCLLVSICGCFVSNSD